MREFLGTVPKKWQLVETFWDCPEISEKREISICLIPYDSGQTPFVLQNKRGSVPRIVLTNYNFLIKLKS